MKNKFKYRVHYGLFDGHIDLPNWRECAAYIKYCLDESVKVRKVEKVLK